MPGYEFFASITLFIARLRLAWWILIRDLFEVLEFCLVLYSELVFEVLLDPMSAFVDRQVVSVRCVFRVSMTETRRSLDSL